MKKELYELLICVVMENKAETVIKTAREQGVSSITYIKGRGTSEYETQSFLGMEIQPEKEVVFMVVPKTKRRTIMQEIALVAGINTEAHGLCFTLPIEEWSGIRDIEILNTKKQEQLQEQQEENKEKDQNKNEATKEATKENKDVVEKKDEKIDK